MRGLLALFAEVLHRADESAPEEVFPDVIHRDARGERVLWCKEPLREVESVRLRGARLERVQHGGHGSADFDALVEEVAAHVSVGLAHARFLGEHGGSGGGRGGTFLAMVVNRGLQFLPLLVHLLAEVFGERLGLLRGALLRFGGERGSHGIRREIRL